MNNIWTKVLLVTAFSISISRGASVINWDFGKLYVDSVGPLNTLADGMAVYLFVSKAGIATDRAGLTTSLVGNDLNVGSTFDYGDKVVIGVATPSFSAFGELGTGNSVTPGITYSLGIDANDALGILFINQVDGIIVAGSKFGVYVSPTLTLPSDPSNVSRSFLETDFGGTVANNSLVTTHTTVIPEPSVLLLSSLGVFALLRRRR